MLDSAKEEDLKHEHHPTWNQFQYDRYEEAILKDRNIVRSSASVQREDSVLDSGSSFASSTSTLMAEKSTITNLPLPAKRYGRFMRNLRWTWFSTYRRLSLLIILANVVAIVVLAIRRHLLQLPPRITATAISVNITAAILIRQELVINLLFAIFGKCPQGFPLCLRRLAAKIYHLGGVHSGAGIATTIWFGIYNINLANLSPKLMYGWLKITIMVLTISLDVLFLGIVILAHPAIRARHHNAFEIVHRFAGWLAIIIFWAHFVLLSIALRKVEHPSTRLIEMFVFSPTFYCLILVTLSLILPWLKLRRVSVHAEPLSTHAIRLHFNYTDLPLCASPRISNNPLREWHSFAGIPAEDGKGFSVIVSNAGDWTARLIQYPPTKLWVRGIPTRGVLHIAPIFKRLVLVATGSGIGPILSLLHVRGLNCRILWSTPDPETTYQRSVVDQVRTADPDAVIINTTQLGRPDLVRQTYDLYHQSNAEAVFLISNPRVTRKVVYALESRGIPIFAPIFDS